MSRTVSFTYSGSAQQWTAPANVASPITVELKGSSGGGAGVNGSAGGRVLGTLNVAPGDVLNLYIGGLGVQGGTGSPFNGGGGGGSGTSLTGCSGGGATDIRKNGTALANRVAVAGGGGGAGRGTGSSNGGQGGAATGAPGSQNGSAQQAPTGGTQTAGGTGGNGPANAAAAGAGTLGTGGSGGANNNTGSYGGGGGGGGYYGGGAGGSVNPGSSGGYSGAGAGGSNYTDGLASTTANERGTGPAGATGTITITYNVTPNAPALTGPADGATLDRTVAQRFSWTFSDDDPGDSQSKADLRFSSDGGNTWSTSTVSTPNGYFDAAAGMFPAGSWQWQVRTYDALSNVGSWSASRFFTAVTPANAPTITYPTNGGTVTQNDRVDWSLSAAQQAYQVQRLADNADGTAPDTSTVYYDSGEVTGDVGVSTRSLPLTFATNNRYEWIRVRSRSSGLLTAWSAVRVLVSYTPPAAATPTAAANQTAATITVAWTTPAPTGTQPTVTSVQVFRRHTDGTGTIRAAVAQAVNGTWIYRTPASGIGYQFMVRTVADNGQTADSGWVS